MSKFKNCQYLNWIEAAKKDTTGEVILQIKAGTGNWRNIKIKSLASGLFPALRHILLTKSVCRLVSLFATVSFMKRVNGPRSRFLAIESLKIAGYLSLSALKTAILLLPIS